MGISSSKFLQVVQEKKDTEEKCENDPRSPTLHISRTPISNLLMKSKSKITKAQDLTTSIATPLSGSYENITTRTLELLSLDPRSPSHQFHRTPLVLNASEEDEAQKLDEDTASESFESALSKISFNSNLEDDEKKELLETNFEYVPPESDTVAEDIDPRSPGMERTPFVFEEDAAGNDCVNETPKSVLNDRGRGTLKVFHDENSQQVATPKNLLLTQEGNRTPLGCLANRGIPRNSLKTPADAKGIFSDVTSENRPITKGLISRNSQSKIPLSTTRRCIEN